MRTPGPGSHSQRASRRALRPLIGCSAAPAGEGAGPAAGRPRGGGGARRQSERRGLGASPGASPGEVRDRGAGWARAAPGARIAPRYQAGPCPAAAFGPGPPGAPLRSALGEPRRCGDAPSELSLPAGRRPPAAAVRRGPQLHPRRCRAPVTALPAFPCCLPGVPWRSSLSAMSVSSHENRKSRSSSGSMNIQLFHKPGHADSLLTHLNLLRKRHLFTDVVLRAGNQAFHCHRAVLASCSRYFEAMFSGGLKESRDAEVNFHDSLHPEVLELLLDYAYSARVLINEENAESLLEAGDMLQFQDIRDASADFLEKNLYPGNCLNMLLLSDAHCCERLLELSWRMALANFTSLCKTEDFLRLPKDKLLELVESEELEVEDETLVYEAVIGWIRYDLPRRHEVLPELLRSVRLALLPESYLRKQVAGEKLVTSHKLGEEIVADAVRCKMKILQNDGLVTGCCARPRKVSQALLLLGGQTFMCDKIYMLDHKTSEIIPRADIPSPRKECSACAIGCKVYITGGKGSENGASKDVWVYDTLHDEWAKAAPMLVARFGHGSAELDHCLYVVGGHTAVSGAFPASPSVSLKQVEHYDPQLDKWSLVAPLREGVSNAAVVGAKMKLFVFGGTSANQEKLPKVQCFDPCQNRWTVPASCPQPWRYTAAAVVGSHIIVIGGDTEFSASSAYRFHSDTYQWSKFGDVTAKRISCRAVTSGNRLYVVGGYCGAQRCKTLDCYDPSSDTWSSVTTVPYSLIPTAFVSTWKYLSA